MPAPANQALLGSRRLIASAPPAPTAILPIKNANSSVIPISYSPASVAAAPTTVQQTPINSVVIPPTVQHKAVLKHEDARSSLITSQQGLYAFQLRLTHQPLPIQEQHYRQQLKKTVTTRDFDTARHADLACNLIAEIEAVKSKGEWSLRQPRRFDPGKRVKSHWDYVLDEARWMALDFRQERRWKMSVAKQLALEACDYVRKNSERNMEVDTETVEMSGEIVSAVKMTDLTSCKMDPALLTYHPEQCSLPLSDLTNKIYHGLELTPLMDTFSPASIPLTYLSSVACKKFVVAGEDGENEGVARYLPKDLLYDMSSTQMRPVLSVPGIDPKPSTSHPSSNTSGGIPVPPPNQSVRATPTWLSEEDGLLLKMTQQFHSNWALIADALNSHSINTPGHLSTGITSRKTPWDCHSRFNYLASKGYVATTNSGLAVGAAQKSKGRREDIKRRVARHTNFLDGLVKMIKKRDQVKMQQQQQKEKERKEKESQLLQSQSAGSGSGSVQVNMQSHVSHQAIATRAGVDPKKPKSVLDLNERRWKMAKMGEGVPGVGPGGISGVGGKPSLGQAVAAGAAAVAAQNPIGNGNVGAASGNSGSSSSKKGTASGSNSPAQSSLKRPVAVAGPGPNGQQQQIPNQSPGAAGGVKMNHAQVQQYMHQQHMRRQAAAAAAATTSATSTANIPASSSGPVPAPPGLIGPAGVPQVMQVPPALPNFTHAQLAAMPPHIAHRFMLMRQQALQQAQAAHAMAMKNQAQSGQGGAGPNPQDMLQALEDSKKQQALLVAAAQSAVQQHQQTHQFQQPQQGQQKGTKKRASTGGRNVPKSPRKRKGDQPPPPST